MIALLNKPIANVKPYEDKVANVPILATLPSPGKITAEKKYDSIGTTVWTLSNGAKVVLKPTDFKK